MIKLHKERQGELIIVAESTLWGLFPIITILSFRGISPLVSFGGSTLIAAIFFGLVLTIKHKWKEVKDVTAYKDILLATFFIGFLMYPLYFFGLKYTSAGNASIVDLTAEIFFSYLLFHVWKKDHLPTQHVVGSLLMITGACIVLIPNVKEFHAGDLLILAEAFVAPFGNLYQRRARTKVSSECILFVRSLITGVAILFFAFLLKDPISPKSISRSLPFLLINGVLLLGFSKILWIEGIHRIAVTKAAAINSIQPLVTLFFAWILLHNLPTIWQLASIVPMFFGIILLGKKNNSNQLSNEKDL